MASVLDSPYPPVWGGNEILVLTTNENIKGVPNKKFIPVPSIRKTPQMLNLTIDEGSIVN